MRRDLEIVVPLLGIRSFFSWIFHLVALLTVVFSPTNSREDRRLGYQRALPSYDASVQDFEMELCLCYLHEQFYSEIVESDSISIDILQPISQTSSIWVASLYLTEVFFQQKWINSYLEFDEYRDFSEFIHLLCFNLYHSSLGSCRWIDFALGR